MDFLNLTYAHIKQDIKELSIVIKNAINIKEIDHLVCITRGGLCVVGELSYQLKIKSIYTISVESYDENNNRHNIKILHSIPKIEGSYLLVDDLIDSSITIVHVLENLLNKPMGIVVLYVKKQIDVDIPIFYSKNINPTTWIEFPWEK